MEHHADTDDANSVTSPTLERSLRRLSVSTVPSQQRYYWSDSIIKNAPKGSSETRSYSRLCHHPPVSQKATPLTMQTLRLPTI